MNEKEFNAMPEKERTNRTLEGLAFYASVHTPNTSAARKFGSPPSYQISLGLETEEDVEKARSYGLKIQAPTDTIPMSWVKIYTKIRAKDGKTPEERFEETKPQVVDSMQGDIPANILIGNGSKVIVKFMTFWHQMSNQHGAGTYINKVQVRKLVPYEGRQSDDGLVMDEDGFTVDTNSAPRPESTQGQKESLAIVDDSVDMDSEAGVVLDPKIFDDE